jgi:hypothetical protein
MRRLLAVAVLLAAGTAQAGEPFGPVNGGSRVIERLSGYPVAPNPAQTRLQPVVGTTRPDPRHFHNLFTHKVRYSTMMCNPLRGTFSTLRFKR